MKMRCYLEAVHIRTIISVFFFYLEEHWVILIRSTKIRYSGWNINQPLYSILVPASGTQTTKWRYKMKNYLLLK